MELAMANGRFILFRDLARDYVDSVERRVAHRAEPWVPTGIAELDAFHGGLYPEELMLVTGRTGNDRTSVAIAAAVAALSIRVPTLFVTLQLSTEGLLDRFVGALRGVSTAALRVGALDYGDLKTAFYPAVEELAELPFAVSPTVSSPEEVAGVIKSFSSDTRLFKVSDVESTKHDGRSYLPTRCRCLVVVDPLETLLSSGDVADVARATRALKRAARDTGASLLVTRSCASDDHSPHNQAAIDAADVLVELVGDQPICAERAPIKVRLIKQGLVHSAGSAGRDA